VGGERGGSGLHQFSCIGKKLMKFEEGHSEEGMGGGGFPRASLDATAWHAQYRTDSNEY
jgi:hypothetical protein